MTIEQIRIASYNLQKCVGLDMRRRPGRSLEVIAALGADVVVLQEADKRLPPRPAALPHEMIEAEGWRIVPLGAPGGTLGWHGNAMLVRPGLSVRTGRHFDLPGLEPRGAILAELDTPIGALRIIGTHLGLIRRHRLLQMAAIIRHIAGLAPMPTVLAGDFNQWGKAARLIDAARGMRFAPIPPSYPAPRPVTRLDRIAHDPRLEVVAAGRHARAPAQIASDHLPVWADLAPAGR